MGTQRIRGWFSFSLYVDSKETVVRVRNPFDAIGDAVRAFPALPPDWRVDGWIDDAIGYRVLDFAQITAFVFVQPGADPPRPGKARRPGARHGGTRGDEDGWATGAWGLTRLSQLTLVFANFAVLLVR